MARFIACSAALLFSTACADAAIDPALYERIFLANMPMFEAITEQVKAKIPEGGRVLDLGSGPGEPTTSLATALPGSRIVSTDVQEAMVEKAKARVGALPNVDFAVTSADDLSAYPDESFAAVTMCYVLMFVPDRQKSVEEIARVLQPGGVAVVAVWKDLRWMTEISKVMRKLVGKKPPPPSFDPMALSGPSAVEDIVNAAALPRLEVLSAEFVIYPMKTGDDKQSCEFAKMLVGDALAELESSGEIPDASEEFCEKLSERLNGEGYRGEDGTFSVTGNVAQMLVLYKPLAGGQLNSEL